jgi:thymidylate synthase
MKATKEDLHESGRPLSQEEFINKIKTDDEFAEKWGSLGPVYGAQWRSWKTNRIKPIKKSNGTTVLVNDTLDQIANLINDLKNNPDSRRLMVNAWNVGELDSMVLPPCHFSFQCYTRELKESERFIWYGNKIGSHMYHDHITQEMNNNNVPTRAISLIWNQRSVDTFLGLPFNIASYGLLLEIIAKGVNMVPDELIGNLGDTHLYLNHIEQAKEQIRREPYTLPKLKHMKTDDFYKSLSEDLSLITHLNPSDFMVENYQSHPTIKAPLSN